MNFWKNLGFFEEKINYFWKKCLNFEEEKYQIIRQQIGFFKETNLFFLFLYFFIWIFFKNSEF